jgi:hypothetical protein
MSSRNATDRDCPRALLAKHAPATMAETHGLTIREQLASPRQPGTSITFAIARVSPGDPGALSLLTDCTAVSFHFGYIPTSPIMLDLPSDTNSQRSVSAYGDDAGGIARSAYRPPEIFANANLPSEPAVIVPMESGC